MSTVWGIVVIRNVQVFVYGSDSLEPKWCCDHLVTEVCLIFLLSVVGTTRDGLVWIQGLPSLELPFPHVWTPTVDYSLRVLHVSKVHSHILLLICCILQGLDNIFLVILFISIYICTYKHIIHTNREKYSFYNYSLV